METQSKKTETVPVQLRLAEPEDLKWNAKNLKIGQSFWLKSKETREFDNSPYIIHEDSDPYEIAGWLKNEMIYVAVSSLDVKKAVAL